MSSGLIRQVREYLRSRGAPTSSWDLASRFLRVEAAREETLVALLSPLLEPGGIVYTPGLGWSLPAGPPQAEAAPRQLRQIGCAVDARGGRIRSLALVAVDPGEPRRIDSLRWLEISRLLEGAEAIFCDPRREPPLLLGGIAARGLAGPARVIGLASAVRGVVRLARRASPEEIARALGCSWPEEPEAAAVAAVVAACLERARGIREDSRGGGPSEARAGLDRRLVREAPSKPGTYRFYDDQDRLLYVGKASNLRRRLSSYTEGRAAPGGAGRRILEEIDRVRRVEYEVAGSEIEALLREADLIASRSPAGNVQRGVHERGRRYAPGRLRALVLPASRGGATLIFLRDGSCAGAFRIGPRGGGRAAASRALRGLLSRAGGPRARRSLHEGRTAIVNSWLARHADRVSQVELDAASGLAGAERLLDAALRDLALGMEEATWHR